MTRTGSTPRKGSPRTRKGRVMLSMTMSLDGFINDRNGSVGSLYPDLDEVRKTQMFQEFVRNTGAIVMGRHAYDMGQGDFTDYEFQVPLFVLTHMPPAKVAKGENDKLTFTFVTNGIENAVAKAKAAAGDRDVVVIGGASTAQQCMNAELVDEIQISTMPVLLGDGLRLFEHPGIEQTELERLEVIQFPGGRTDMRFRIVK